MKIAKEKFTLGLQLPTDPRWVDAASMNLEFILSDHAYCEQKAASAMISLIQLYPERTALVEQLAPVVTEEWGHFRLVLAQLKKRGLQLGRQRNDQYVKGLLSGKTKGGSQDDLLLDNLLMCALIEARSCERFRLLSQELEDKELQEFYHQFMIAEAGHYKLFLKLAKTYIPEEKVKTRWQHWLDHEVEVLKKLEPRGDRMH